MLPHPQETCLCLPVAETSGVLIERQKRASRVRFRHPVRVVTLGGQQRVIRTLTANVSHDGLFLLMPEPLPHGTKVALSLEAGGRALALAQAEVVWDRTDQSELPDHAPGCGVRFTEFMHPRAKELVNYLVDNLDQGRPLALAPPERRWRKALPWVAAAAAVATVIVIAVISLSALGGEGQGEDASELEDAEAAIAAERREVVPASASAVPTLAPSDSPAPGASNSHVEEPVAAAPVAAAPVAAAPVAAAPVAAAPVAEPVAAAPVAAEPVVAAPASVPDAVGPVATAPTAAPKAAAPVADPVVVAPVAAPVAAAPVAAAPTAAPEAVGPVAEPVAAAPVAVAPVAVGPVTAAPVTAAPVTAAPAAAGPVATRKGIASEVPAARGATASIAQPKATPTRRDAAARSGPERGTVHLPSGAASKLTWVLSGTELRLSPDGNVSRAFLLASPARAVFDLDGRAPDRSRQLAGSIPHATGVRLGKQGKGTRIVVDLDRAPSRSSQDGSALVLSF